MKVKFPKYIYDRFNNLSNIEYEIKWIIGYCDKNAFKMGCYRNIEYRLHEFVEVEITNEIDNYVARFIESDKCSDVEKAIVVLYMTLLFLGGTN